MAKAVHWYRKGAELGCPDAQYALACCCRRGLGIDRDAGRAMTWLQRAAAAGHGFARRDLERLDPETGEVRKGPEPE